MAITSLSSPKSKTNGDDNNRRRKYRVSKNCINQTETLSGYNGGEDQRCLTLTPIELNESQPLNLSRRSQPAALTSPGAKQGDSLADGCRDDVTMAIDYVISRGVKNGVTYTTGGRAEPVATRANESAKRCRSTDRDKTNNNNDKNNCNNNVNNNNIGDKKTIKMSPRASDLHSPAPTKRGGPEQLPGADLVSHLAHNGLQTACGGLSDDDVKMLTSYCVAYGNDYRAATAAMSRTQDMFHWSPTGRLVDDRGGLSQGGVEAAYRGIHCGLQAAAAVNPIIAEQQVREKQ